LHIARYTEALDAIRQCLRLRRNHIEGTLLLGTIYQAMGKGEQARKCFLQALAVKGCTEKQTARAQRHLAQFSESV